FVQAEGSVLSKHEGVGLGLYISKSYVELLDGEIWVRSDKGLGSNFFFTIPFTKTKNSTNNTIIDSKELAQKKQKRKLNILIVDDDEVSATYLYELLEELSNKIVIVRSGYKAIEYITENNDIDLIMMDIKLPGMSGYETTRRIRMINKKVTIIAQTSYALLGDRKKTIEAGCNEYISKPINQDILLSIINKLQFNETDTD
ncbi:MAG: response regulator, partial [Bacteroidales bacterium]|nr:response regulator [Bacteroidales bacterium]